MEFSKKKNYTKVVIVCKLEHGTFSYYDNFIKIIFFYPVVAPQSERNGVKFFQDFGHEFEDRHKVDLNWICQQTEIHTT